MPSIARRSGSSSDSSGALTQRSQSAKIKRGGENPIDRKWRKRKWVTYLRELELEWRQIKQISIDFGTAIPPPWNLWWSDLPLNFIPLLIQSLTNSKIQNGAIIIPNIVENWPFDESVVNNQIPEQISNNWPRWTEVKNHGVVKSSLMTLGVEHYHESGNLIIDKN